MSSCPEPIALHDAARSAPGSPLWPALRMTLTEARTSALVAQVDGELDMATAPHLDERLVRVLAQDGISLLVVDLTHVRFLAAAGISSLLGLRARARERHVTFRVVAAHRAVTRPLDLLGLMATFDLCPTRELALLPAPGERG